MPRRPPTFRASVAKRVEPETRLTSRQRGYSSTWDRASRAYRHLRPLCEYCDAGALGEERTELATHVDHLYPQRRFPGVFWDQTWWVSCCKACDAAKQALEHGPLAGLDALAARLGRPKMAHSQGARGGLES